MAVRPRFDPARDFVAARGFTFAGADHGSGDPFDKTAATPTRLSMMYESRMINFAPEKTADADPVSVVQVSGGYYNVDAPWLDEPIRARGKAKMEEAAAQLRKDGPPLGWIAGGTLTTIDGPNDGGWYHVDAPWLDEPVAYQGRENAEKAQRLLHETGEPDYHHGVTLTPGENGWWSVSANWDPENVAKVQGEEAARDLATQWRAEGPPADPVTITAGTDEGMFVITAAWLDEPVTIEGEDNANAAADEIRAAGPPEGWEPPADNEA